MTLGHDYAGAGAADVQVLTSLTRLVALGVTVRAVPSLPRLEIVSRLASLDVVAMLARRQMGTTSFACLEMSAGLAGLKPVMSDCPMAPRASMRSMRSMTAMTAMTSMTSVAQMPRVTTMAVERATDCCDQQEQAREGGAAREEKKQVIMGKHHCHADHLQAGSIGSHAGVGYSLTWWAGALASNLLLLRATRYACTAYSDHNARTCMIAQI